jgi:ACT domain-containing protein
VKDAPGGLAGTLEALSRARANLQCVICRRSDRKGKGLVFLAPVTGRKAAAGAKKAKVRRAKNIATLRIEGPDRRGLGARMTRAVAKTGVSMRGLSAMTLGGKFVAYVGFDRAGDATKAARALRSLKA